MGEGIGGRGVGERAAGVWVKVGLEGAKGISTRVGLGESGVGNSTRVAHAATTSRIPMDQLAARIS